MFRRAREVGDIGWATSVGNGSGVHESPPSVVEAITSIMVWPPLGPHEKEPLPDAAAFRFAFVATRDSDAWDPGERSVERSEKGLELGESDAGFAGDKDVCRQAGW
jgi:hypothetical protein